jgi:endonuclease/exonuclease/phosphatase family metal-dependent hydrolase
MKHIIPLIILSALTISACVKETSEDGGQRPLKTFKDTISVRAELNSGVKAVYKDGQGLGWTDADAQEMGLLCGSSFERTLSTAITIGENDASFTVPVPNASETEYNAFYPASLATVTGSKISFNVPQKQVQALAGASDDKQIMLVSKSVTKTGSSFVAAMKPAAAIVRFIVYSSDADARTRSVRAVRIYAGNEIAGSLSCDMATSSTTTTGTTKTVSVTLGTPYSLSEASSKDASGTKGIYAQLLPGASVTRFVVSTSGGKSYSFTFSSPVVFSGNGITNVFADLSKGTASYEVFSSEDLKAAVNGASAGETVKVAAGTYPGTIILKDGVNISGGWDDFFIASAPETNKTIIDGGGTTLCVSQKADFSTDALVSGLTLQNGFRSGDGGCAYLRAKCTLDNCTITGGNATQGAGVFLNGACTIQNSTISGNKSTSHGGGLYINSGASVINCTVDNNTAGGNGGGINVNGYATIERCMVRGNKSASNGAGMSLRSSDSRGVVVSNCLVEGNTNTASGASGINIYSSDGGKPVMIYNCTVVENTTSESGNNAVAIYCSDQKLYFANNIVYGNTGSTVQVYLYAYGDNGPYLSNNAITSGSLKLKDSSTSVLGAVNLSAKPYGSDYRLSATSVCVDAGASDLAVTGGIYSLNLSKDLDGKTRVCGMSPDIGCYEYQGTSTPTYSTKIRLATFNIRCIKDTDTGVRSWTTRKNYCKTIINDNSLDVVGFQEVTTTQAGDLRTLLGDKYSFYFIGRDDGTNGECVGVGYDKSLFSIVNKGYFWLSPTPDTYLNALAWGGTHNRIAVWMRLKFLTTGDEFYIMATHLEVNGDGTDMSEVRRKSAELIISRAKSIDTDRVPFFLVGDMNAASLNEPAQAEFKTYFTDAYYAAENKGVRSGCISTYNAFEDAPNLSNAGRRADYIYMRGSYDLRGYNVVQTKYDGNWPSDHMPVYIDVKF